MLFRSIHELPLLRTSQLGFKFYDALHLAFAEAGGADIFLTTIIASLDRADVEHPAQSLLHRSEHKCRDLPAVFESP